MALELHQIVCDPETGFRGEIANIDKRVIELDNGDLVFKDRYLITWIEPQSTLMYLVEDVLVYAATERLRQLIEARREERFGTEYSLPHPHSVLKRDREFTRVPLIGGKQ